MRTIQANFTASISELKKSPAQILKQAGDNVVAILNHNVPSAYLVPSTVYEKMTEIIDDYYLSKAVDTALASGEKPVKVSYELEFLPSALKEWQKLDNSVKAQFKKKLAERLENPKVAKDELRGYENIYKIKLKDAGYRLAYQVKDAQITILVLVVGRRENDEAYELLKDRI